VQKKQLDTCSRFDTIPACDRHRHTTIANTALAWRRAVKTLLFSFSNIALVPMSMHVKHLQCTIRISQKRSSFARNAALCHSEPCGASTYGATHRRAAPNGTATMAPRGTAVQCDARLTATHPVMMRQRAVDVRRRGARYNARRRTAPHRIRCERHHIDTSA